MLNEFSLCFRSRITCVNALQMLIHAGHRFESFFANNTHRNLIFAAAQFDGCAAIRFSDRHKRCVCRIFDGNNIEVAQHGQRLYRRLWHQTNQVVHQTVGIVETVLGVIFAFFLFDFPVEQYVGIAENDISKGDL